MSAEMDNKDLLSTLAHVVAFISKTYRQLGMDESQSLDALSERIGALQGNIDDDGEQIDLLALDNNNACAEIKRLKAERDDLLAVMRSTDPIQAANCRVLEYHQLKEEVERLTREISIQRDEIEILTTVRDGWQQKCRAAEAELSAALVAASEKTQTPPERHAICGNCGWTGPESGLFDDGKFIFCPQCRNSDGNTLRPVETVPAGNG